MQLPKAIETYFAAVRDGDADRLATAFAPDAVVRDEGAVHAGRDAITAWQRAAQANYDAVAEPIEAAEAHGDVVVRANVSGRFQGSPIVLAFTFRLRDDAIAALEIG